MAVTIQDFLVSLGFKVDYESQRKFFENIGETAKRVGEMAAAIELAAVGIIEHMHRIAESMERQVITAGRLGGTVGGLSAVAKAIGQMGGDAGRAQEQFGKLAEEIDHLPGKRRQIESILRIRGQGHTADQILGEDMPRYLRDLAQKRGIAYALSYGENALGLNSEMIRAMIRPGFEAMVTEQARIVHRLSDPELQKNLEEFLARYKNIMTQFEVISTEVAANIEKQLGPQLNEFYKWLSTHHVEIVQAITDISNILLQMAKWVLETALRLDQWAQKHPGWAKAFLYLGVVIAGVVPGLSMMLFLLRSMASLVMPKWLFGGRPGGATPGGATPRGGGVGLLGALGIYGGAAAGAYMLGQDIANVDTPDEEVRPGPHVGVDDAAVGAARWIKRGWRWMTGQDGGKQGKVGKWWTTERMRYAADRLVKEAGLSEMGASGLVARWSAIEASGGPTDKNNESGGHWGIAQWSRARGGPWIGGMPFEEQVSWAIHELQTTEKRAAGMLTRAKTPMEGSTGASQFERGEDHDPVTGMDRHTARTPTQAVHDLLYPPAQAGGGATPPAAAPTATPKPQASIMPGAAYAQLGGPGLGVDAGVMNGDIDRSITLTQNVTNNIDGAGDPAKVGEAVASRMQRPIAETLRGFSSGVA